MKVYSAVKITWKASYIRLYVKFKCKESMIICLIIRKNACERNGICSALCYMLQYSISMLKALSAPTRSSTTQLITKYLVSMIKICFCSNNDGDY